MPTFILVRHSETADNVDRKLQGWNDPELSDNGRVQAAQIADQLHDERPDIIFASDLIRCQQTASYIHGAYQNAPLLVDWRLRERSFGTLEGSRHDEIDWDAFDATPPDQSPNGAEPINNLVERLKSFIRDTELLYSSTIIIVTHNGVMNRFGFMFDENHTRQKYNNTEIVRLEINYDDPRLSPHVYSPWEPRA